MNSARVRGVTAAASRSRSSVQPSLPNDIGTSTGARADDAGRGRGIRPGRRRDHDLVARACDHREHDLDRLHAGAGDVELLRRERPAVERRVIARERLAQFRNAALPGVEGLAGRKRARRGLADEGGRRQIALADPQRDQPVAPAAVIRDLDDAALRRALRARARERIAERGGCGFWRDSFIATPAGSALRTRSLARQIRPSHQRLRGRSISLREVRPASSPECRGFPAAALPAAAPRRVSAGFSASLRCSWLMPRTTRNSTHAMITKLITMVRKLPQASTAPGLLGVCQRGAAATLPPVNCDVSNSRSRGRRSPRRRSA